MTHSLKSIVISLLLSVCAMPSWSCIWTGTHNYYLFSLCDRDEFSSRADRVCTENWRAYLGAPSDEYFYFSMEDAKERVQMKGDQLMASYLEHLDRYLSCAREVMYEQWDYPTKEQLAQRQQTLEQVRAYAEGQLRSRLRSQHALLLMRCNMLLQRHAENVTFWEQTAVQFIETIYKEMMRDIYAGALLHTGRGDEAAQIFAELGDWKSLMTQFYKRRSCQAISEEYHRDPNSAVLPFLLQDFVNNAQEAVDGLEEGGGGTQGKLFVRDIEKQEALQMCRLAEEAAANPATRQPLMWQTARAWLEYLFGDGKKAVALIRKTDGMEGNRRMKDCTHVIGFYLSAATGEGATRTFDDYADRELKWLESMTDSSYFCECARERVVYQALVPRYEQAGRQETALALLKAVGAWQYDACLDTMSVAALQRFANYAHSTDLGTLDRHLAKGIRLDEDTFADLMGTKHLRLCQWRQARQWLASVPAAFYVEKGYAPYAAYRRWAVEPWLTRQWLPSDLAYSAVEKDMLLANPKLVFAQEMETMEADLNVLTGNERELRCYDLAVRYAQATFTGDCWYLMRDSKSVADTVRTNETDLQARARKLLAEAARSKNTKLRERALFALAYGGLYPENQCWYDYQWDSKLMKSLRVPQPATQQYRALSALAVFSKQAPVSDYVSRCDEYKQFCKQLK